MVSRGSVTAPAETLAPPITNTRLSGSVWAVSIERPWVIGFELPLGPGVHRTVMLTCTLAHRRHRADGILYGVRFVELGLPVNAAQRQALELFLADLRGRPGPQPPPGADAPGTPPDTGNA